jgi:hypothetical protein
MANIIPDFDRLAHKDYLMANSCIDYNSNHLLSYFWTYLSFKDQTS